MVDDAGASVVRFDGGRPIADPFLRLPRMYRFAEPEEDRADDLARPLWLSLRRRIDGGVPSLLRDHDSLAYMLDRSTNYTYVRLVVRGVQVYRAWCDAGTDEEDRTTRFNAIVDELIDLPSNDRRDIAWHVERICIAIERDRHELARGQRRRIAKFADAHAHRCYICGASLDYSGARRTVDGKLNRVAFEIEHIVPGARGGSRSPDNLASACNACNQHKRDALTYVDIAIETAITTSLNPEHIKWTFGGRNLFALLWSQDGVCAMCSNPFYGSKDERLFLFRRETDDGYHFLNVQVACGTCTDTLSLEGVELR